MADLRVNFCGVPFKNPIVVSSIEVSDSLEHINQAIDSGVGGVVIKTVTDQPKMGKLTKHSKYAILNDKGEIIRGKISRFFVFYARSGYSIRPPEEWPSIIREARKHADLKDVRLIGSVGASSLDKWVELARMEEDCGVCLLELNFGCPHPSQMDEVGAGMLLGQDPKAAEEITRTVVNAVHIPVLVKLTPQVNDVTAMARVMKKAGASGVLLTNRYTGFAVNIEEGKPHIDGRAGVGGPWVRHLALRWVNGVYLEGGIPIVGTNGIYDWREAVEFFMSGATLMEVGSVLMLKGYGHAGKIIRGLEQFMDRKGYKTMDSMIGIASRRALTYEQTYELPRMVAVIDEEKCTRCYNCVRSCFYDALKEGEGRVITNSDHCIGCELCYSVCPADAVLYRAGSPTAAGIRK
jgi:dihydroorotate dehydrogenase subfamily 1